MTALDLLQQLQALGVILEPHPDGALYCRAPKGILAPDVLAAMRQHKAELHGLVEAFEERAAIMEYCGGVSRTEAERLAWLDVLGGGQTKAISGSIGGCSATLLEQGDTLEHPGEKEPITPAQWAAVQVMLDQAPAPWIAARPPDVLEGESSRTVFVELRPPGRSWRHEREMEAVPGVQTVIYPLPDPFDTLEQYAQYHHRDVRGMPVDRLELEYTHVLWRLAHEARPHPWLQQRRHAIRQAMALSPVTLKVWR
jgi:hypothetical protein